MGLIIGMDEAGYGPNLGPLVISATVWRVPGDPRQVDFWKSLGSVVSQSATKDSDRIHVADSKEVYLPSRGIQPLNDLQQRIRKRESHDLSPIQERDVPEEVAPLVGASCVRKPP